ncbi:MAG: imidazole glycerol phosphate synthase subunit HisH [Nitrososphaeria archaeon]|nr:imidazole glycerol phosphate synthase subunit HisH [Nitrososphaeria archaeon]
MIFAVIDYGASNMFSLIASLKRANVQVKIVDERERLEKYSAIILPGVGNFTSAVQKISNLKNEILDAVAKGTYIFGICLGMQLLFNESEEGQGEGLSIFRGKVVKFPKTIKVPHMGWNLVEPQGYSLLLSDFERERWAYFAHSYYPNPSNNNIVKGITHYGIKFVSVVEEGNIFGTQFHPEKSGEFGRRIIKNFVEYVRR